MSEYGFTKLFNSITKSTVWCEPHTTFRVWIALLADCDRHGRVLGSIPGLANLSRVTLAECEAAINTFLAPDPYSRTPDFEGRRIEVIPGGWRLLNYDMYRDKRDDGARREQNREAQQRRRDRLKTSDEPSDTSATLLTPGDKQEKSAQGRRQRTDQQQGQEQKQPSPSAKALPACPDWINPEAWDGFVAMRARIRFPLTPRAAQLVFRELQKLGGDPNELLDQSTRNGWRDVYALKDARPINGQPKPGKQMQGLMALEELKNAARDRMAVGGDCDGPAEARNALPGPHARR